MKYRRIYYFQVQKPAAGTKREKCQKKTDDDLQGTDTKKGFCSNWGHNQPI